MPVKRRNCSAVSCHRRSAFERNSFFIVRYLSDGALNSYRYTVPSAKHSTHSRSFMKTGQRSLYAFGRLGQWTYGDSIYLRKRSSRSFRRTRSLIDVKPRTLALNTTAGPPSIWMSKPLLVRNRRHIGLSSKPLSSISS